MALHTECRLSPMAVEMLRRPRRGRPRRLRAELRRAEDESRSSCRRASDLLVNAGSGIAVGNGHELPPPQPRSASDHAATAIDDPATHQPDGA